MESLTRRGKYLRFLLDNGEMLVIHLRMTGVLSMVELPLKAEQKKHLRLLICLKDRACLAFHDTRRFGTASVLPPGETGKYWSKLGPEPLEKSFNATRLKAILNNRSGPIKPLLLDQRLIAGIGNIYADESLFAARIHPLRPADGISDAETAALVRAIKATLSKAIRLGGSSIDTYRALDGSQGRFQETFQVHRRAGEPCPVCGGSIEKIKVGGRGTYFCPACQK